MRHEKKNFYVKSTNLYEHFTRPTLCQMNLHPESVFFFKRTLNLFWSICYFALLGIGPQMGTSDLVVAQLVVVLRC
jgi:hypothetical protein